MTAPTGLGTPAGDARPLIGFGTVRHRRLRPVEHAFSYPGYFLLLPMRSLARRPAAALARNRWSLLSFHDRDHGDGGADELLAREGIADAVGEVWLQTYPRVLGYAFKPVSFWHAQRADGSLAACVVEVNNTFGERHCYLLAGPGLRFGAELRARKAFHVSPFGAVEGHYAFRFLRSVAADGTTPRRVLARIDHEDALGPLLQTSVGGELEALTPSSIRRAFFRMPLMTFGVVARIHWQALRLWAKRVPFFGKPQAPARFTTR
jgi:DUF1365 family protein